MKLSHKLMIILFASSSNLFSINYKDNPELNDLFEWPNEKPNIQKNPHSMFSNSVQIKKLHDTMKVKPAIIIELGSWVGASTKYFLETFPSSIVIAIDHWQGSDEHFTIPECKIMLPTLYETFLVNCWDYQSRLIPLKTTTLEGLKFLHQKNVPVDMIYIDAAHDYESVLLDLKTAYELFPNALITGDDWGWPSVRKAVNEFIQNTQYKVISEVNFWYISK